MSCLSEQKQERHLFGQVVKRFNAIAYKTVIS